MKHELLIEGRRISNDDDCFLIAEIGHNHQGSLEKCITLFDAAKKAGASAVKLQKRDNKNLFTRKFFNEPYNCLNAYGPTYGLHREALELSIGDMQKLKEYAKKIGIIFFVTPFDINSADALMQLNVPAFKIASADIKNHHLIEHIASYKKPIILSTGGATLEEVRSAVNIVLKHHSMLAILQCTAVYPPKDEEINLTVIQTYLREFPNLVIGYSGHELGIAVPLAAFTLGARIIEKHFTLDKSLPGNDHKLSLTPDEFELLSKDLRKVHKALGNGNKSIYPSELSSIQKMGKKLVALKDLPSGHVIGPHDIAIKSPGDGLPPSSLNSIIGKRLKTSLMMEEDITCHVLE